VEKRGGVELVGVDNTRWVSRLRLFAPRSDGLVLKGFCSLAGFCGWDGWVWEVLGVEGKIRNGKLPKMLGTGELGLWAFVMLLWCKMEVAGLHIHIHPFCWQRNTTVRR